MGHEVGFHEDVIEFFNVYLQTRPAELPNMLGRILREWYSTGLKQWITNPNMMPVYSKEKATDIKIKEDGLIPYQKIPESKKVKIQINGRIGKTYNDFCNTFNINPDDNATYQCRLFIKVFKLKHFKSLNKKRSMEKLQPK